MTSIVALSVPTKLSFAAMTSLDCTAIRDSKEPCVSSHSLTHILHMAYSVALLPSLCSIVCVVAQ